MPELLWKAFIDFEIEQQEYDRARKLYNKLLKKTQHVKVWLSLAQFEATIDEPDSIDRTREIFEQAYKTLRTASDKEERLMLVEHWLDFEVRRISLTGDRPILRVFLFCLRRENEEQKIVSRVFKRTCPSVSNNVERFSRKTGFVRIELLADWCLSRLLFRTNLVNGKNTCSWSFLMMNLFNLT